MAASIMFDTAQYVAFVCQQFNVVCVVLCVCVRLNTDALQHAALAELANVWD